MTDWLRLTLDASQRPPEAAAREVYPIVKTAKRGIEVKTLAVMVARSQPTILKSGDCPRSPWQPRNDLLVNGFLQKRLRVGYSFC